MRAQLTHIAYDLLIDLAISFGNLSHQGRLMDTKSGRAELLMVIYLRYHKFLKCHFSNMPIRECINKGSLKSF